MAEPAPRCPECDAELTLAVMASECETSIAADGRTVLQSVGRLDRADFVCPNGHVQEAPARALRVTGISADTNGVIIARFEPRP